MANPLKILTQLSASEAAEFTKAVKFKEVVTMDNKKITGLASGVDSTDAVAYGQHSTEVSRAQSAEGSLTTRVSTEESRAASAEGSLTSRVSAEESVRASADGSLTTRVSTEESARASADGSLTTRVSTEESRAASAEGSLTSRVSTEESRAASAEGSLEARISTEESVRGSADSSLTSRVSAEESRAASVEGSLESRLSTEESVRGSADSSLTSRVSAEESVRASADTSLTSRLSAEESRAASAESVETSRAQSAEGSLTSRVSTEESRAASAEGSLTSRVSAEESVRASADESLTTRVSTEESVRASADGSLTTRISTEESARSSSEISLNSRLSTEESARSSADGSLTTRISTEESARAAEDLTFLKLDGSRAMTGHLDMGTKSITNANSASFSGNVTVGGDLHVNGSLTYLGTTNTQIKDNQLELNIVESGSAVSLVNAGIVIRGDGVETDITLLGDSDNDLAVNVGLKVGGGLQVTEAANFDAAVNISGSSFTPINAAFDAMLGYDAGTSKINVSSALFGLAAFVQSTFDVYNSARHVVKANLASGTHTFALPAIPKFEDTQIDKIALDVMVNDSGVWKNDLVSVWLQSDGFGYLEVVVDAPAHANNEVRLIAVNEAWDLSNA